MNKTISKIKPEAKSSGRFTVAVHNVAYICVGLAIVLAVTQFWLYGVRYRRVFSPEVWASVTLANGQSYIGHLEQYGPNTLVLFNAYYLQAVPTDDATASDTTATTEEVAANPASDLKLISIAEDLHKPHDYLIINQDQVLYWQQLSGESPIVQTLEGQAAD